MALAPPRLYNPQHDHPILPSIAHLHALCITHSHTLATFLPPLSHSKILSDWEAWSREVEVGKRVIVLQLTSPTNGEEMVAGVVSLFMPESETGRHRGEIGRLLVSPEVRKQGVGRALMRVVEGEARERGRWMITLDTTIGSGAEHVYPKLGYKEIGVVPNFGFSPKDGSLVDEVFFYKDLREGESG
ncbi:hypothetical protein Q7P37_006123 [Cladosporium fusiforme]